jgi:FPC/CPF motif-containing protein YcgG
MINDEVAVTDLSERFHAFIADKSFPCIGAKSAVAKDQLTVLIARDIRSNWDDRHIYEATCALAFRYRENQRLFQSLAVIFESPENLDERSFEKFLWQRAVSLTNKDIWHQQAPDARVSNDPNDPHFSLSFAGEAFFIVGLHPKASRPARRFEKPALVFNLHDQFERLREEGRYEKMRAAIIKRDVALAGSANPMLARHGLNSEAKQYSGRAVSENWECPFNPVERSQR